MKEVKTIKPFTRFLMTIGELPSSYLMSMTYEEQLLWFCNFLQNTVVPTVNNNSEAVIELQEYVANYFENLELQEEVDHKLDEMAESGELAELISKYLDLDAVFGYDTIADMAASENLKDGTDVYCLGEETYDDGKGAFYKIREITLADVVDGYNIVAITNSIDLVGERLPNYYINTINSTLETLTETTIPGIQDDISTINNTTIPGIQDDISTINNTTIPGIQDDISTINNTTIPGIEDDISTINNTTIPGIQDDISGIQQDITDITTKKTMVVIGDSYSCEGLSGSPLWHYYVSKWHNQNVYNKSEGGMGYVVGNHTFLDQLQTTYNDPDLNNDLIEDIYIVGGLNDLGDLNVNDSTFESAINSTLTYANTNFPHAKIHVIGILPFQYYNWYQGQSCFTDGFRAYRWNAILGNCCINSNYRNIIYRNGQYFGLIQDGYFGNINYLGQKHPTAKGQKMLANFIENNEKCVGYRDGNPSITDILSTPLTCSNGTATLTFIDGKQAGINISGYDNSQPIDLSLSGLPYMNTYVTVGDQAGHFAWMWTENSTQSLRMGGGSGLNSGNIFISINWDMLD